MATAYLEIRSQKAKGVWPRQGPDKYVAVQIVPDGVEPLVVLNQKIAKKRGIILLYCGEGYYNRTGPRKLFKPLTRGKIMKKEKALVALFDGKVIRGHDTELRISKGQLQERRLPKGSWENTSTGGWLWENFEIATDPVDFMTAWKDMLINRSKYTIKDFEDEGGFYIDSFDGILMRTINGITLYEASISEKIIEGEWCKV